MNEENAIPVYAGSGNVFADLGLPDAEEALAKARLAQAIAGAIERKGLSQGEAAGIMGLDQPKVSALVRGRLSGFSTDRLFRCLTLLGHHTVRTLLFTLSLSKGERQSP
jgi:predicted XRE-type DNA-binding protein